MDRIDIDKYRKNRGERLKKAEQKLSSTSYTDDRFWKPTFDKESGKTNATIRFLPSRENNELYVELYKHFAKNKATNKIVSCNCAQKSIKQPCAICDHIARLYKELPREEAGETSKKFGLFANVRYITNVMVIDDKQNPENNGKVFLFDMAKSIFQLISETPELLDSAYDYIDGYNFILRGKKSGVVTYDASDFSETASSIDGPACNPVAISAILEKTYELSEFKAEKSFPKYENIEAKLKDALGIVGMEKAVSQSQPAPQAVAEEVDEDIPAFNDDFVKPSNPAPVSTATETEDDDEIVF